MKLSYISVIVLFFGCQDSTNNNIKNVYQNRQEILASFSKKTIHRINTSRYVFLYTYNGNHRNEYVLVIDDKGTYSLHRETILFAPDFVLGINKNESNGRDYLRALISKINTYCRKMDSLGIGDISSDFYREGISLKIYLKEKGVIIYIQNRENIQNMEWQKYIQSMNNLDDHWYYTKESE